MEELDPSFKISYAQNCEDIVLNYFFKDVLKGFYVDVGAGHPEQDSVTKLFYDRGWRGINVEPINNIYKLLQKSRPRDINLNIGLSDKKGRETFREYENYGLSTFTAGMKKEYASTPGRIDKYKDYEVPVDTLAGVLDLHGVKHTHFLKVDVEGLEYEVLEGNDWHRHHPDVICIEANHMIKDWRPLLESNSYERVFNDGLNDYYVSNEFSRKKSFSYVGAFLSDVRPINFRVAEVVDKEMAALSSKSLVHLAKNLDLTRNIEQLEYEIHGLHSQLATYQRTRSLIKVLLARVDFFIEAFIYPHKYRNQLKLASQNVKLTLHNEVLEQLKAINEYDKIILPKIKIAYHPFRFCLLEGYRKIKFGLIHIIRISQHTTSKINQLIKRKR